MGVALMGLRFNPRPTLWRTLSMLLSLLVLAVLAIPPAAKIVPSLAHSWARGVNAILPRTIWRTFQDAVNDPRPPEEYGEAVPPNESSKLPKNPIIIYYSVDSLRADLLDPRYKKLLPNIHALKKDSFVFFLYSSIATAMIRLFIWQTSRA